ncbi:hypothetical protein L484_003935 [Morus notabilis]|uniref:DUF7906 domain-containing protein n=1 Tax=Morus notabilis TaxID=981085 RepID=W9QYB3_9ROSA|nr:hypothetical protein L484_003935 [Morus notabilis]
MDWNWSRRERLLSFLCLFSLLLSQPRSLDGSPAGTPKSSSSSVFSLFNLKDKSRFWTESVIRTDFDDLQSSTPAKTSLLNYTKAGNIANYLNLLEVDSMYLPIPVNFIFIGFEGKGNLEFKLESKELERWFTKIDHIFEHARVPQNREGFDSFYKISSDKDQRHHHLPIVSHINYNFSVHAILMGEKVTSIFERALNVVARDDDVSGNRENGDAVLQVDVELMDDLVSNLVEYLRLENAYNIFILNPKRDAKRTKYGYRRGLSDSEIKYLNKNKNLQSTIRQSRSTPETVLAFEKIKRPLYEKHPGVEFALRIAEDSNTVEWYNMCLDALNNIEKSTRGKETADIIQSKVLRILKGKSEDMKLLFEKELRSGDFSGVHAECLTDMWIGKDRWAFIDLSAGPFSWGPAVGGEGVRTELSLPNVEKTIGAVSEISEDEAENRLQDAIQEKFAVFGDKDHQAIDILLAEIDIYELFAFKHCKGRRVKLALCEELDERMQDLKNELQSFEGEEYDETHKRKAIEALKRMEKWNLFTESHEKFRRVDQLPVDLDALKNGLSSLLLPSQKFSFNPNVLPLSEDPALAMAFSVARRAAAVPLLLVNGTYRKNIHTYLDSSILQYQLQRLNDHGSLKGRHAHSRSTLEVPIFWFIYGEPLFVDKHHRAKALSDMVIVVQSEASSWESHLQCNGQSILRDLRKPIKAALAATSEHMAGLLPLHLVYSQAHDAAMEASNLEYGLPIDWIWSVGSNPHSITSQGWRISQFQSDAIARSYIITTLEDQPMKSLIGRAAFLQSNKQLFVLKQAISTVTGELRYVDAMRLLHTLEDASKGDIAHEVPLHVIMDEKFMNPKEHIDGVKIRRNPLHDNFFDRDFMGIVATDEFSIRNDIPP